MSRNLSKKEIIKVVSEISEELLESLGYELVDVEYQKEFGDYYLRIYIYSEDGVFVDDCEKISRQLSSEIDEKDPIPGAYYLEVSSPGLDRPISTDKDLKRNLNKKVEIKLYKPLNNRKNLEGILTDFSDDDIKIKENEEELVIPRNLISLMRLAIEF